MAKKEVKNTETAVAIVPPVRKDLILEGDPEAQLAFAQKAATALMKVAKPINIQGKEYLPFGSWQILGRFFGSTVGVEWTKKIEENGKLMGYEARAIVYRSGEVISSAEASCMKTERNWGSRDEYAIKSMAQTRACAKALRNAFGWVAEMANYASTPFEEMDGIDTKMPAYRAERKTYPAMDETNDVAPLKEEKKPSAGTAKMDIAKLLLKNYKYTMLGKSAKEVSDKVFDITGLLLEEGNYAQIVERLSVTE